MLLRLLALAAALFLLTPATALATRLARLSSAERSVLRELNQVRRRHGLGALRVDTHLERAARSHTREMLATGVFEHGAFAARMLRFDVAARLAGENLAWGSGSRGTAQSIIDAWLASPGHRANLLRPSYTRIGIGDLAGAFLGTRDAHVVTADFAG